VTYACAVPLAPGAHTAKLKLGAVEKSWSFTVPDAAATPAADAPTVTPRGGTGSSPRRPRRQVGGHQPSAAGAAADPGLAQFSATAWAQLSGQLDLAERRSPSRDRDLAFRRDLSDPRRPCAGSWLLRTGVSQGGLGLSARAATSRLTSAIRPRSPAGLMRGGMQSSTRPCCRPRSTSRWVRHQQDPERSRRSTRPAGRVRTACRNPFGSMVRAVLLEADSCWPFAEARHAADRRTGPARHRSGFAGGGGRAEHAPQHNAQTKSRDRRGAWV
jgi:hypothetical protein